MWDNPPGGCDYKGGNSTRCPSFEHKQGSITVAIMNVIMRNIITIMRNQTPIMSCYYELFMAIMRTIMRTGDVIMALLWTIMRTIMRIVGHYYTIFVIIILL